MEMKKIISIIIICFSFVFCNAQDFVKTDNFKELHQNLLQNGYEVKYRHYVNIDDNGIYFIRYEKGENVVMVFKNHKNIIEEIIYKNDDEKRIIVGSDYIWQKFVEKTGKKLKNFDINLYL